MRRLRSWLLTVLFVASLAGRATMVSAGTTGSISGTVTSKSTGTPIGDAKITAASPSQVAGATTDSAGRFTLLSLAPETYRISIEKAGFVPLVEAAVTVQADQTQVLALQAIPEIKTIGRAVSRSSGSLVKAGVTTDVYSITPTGQAAAAPLSGGNNLNAAYSAISSIPGTFVPISFEGGFGQTINIRGGDYTQTGNEIDGIPINRAFDQYAASPLSNLGNAEVQVYTGSQPADGQANGLAGFVNQVIKTGTYPGYSNADLGIGGPGYYHKFSIETGGASANRNFSYYAGFLGYNQNTRWVDQFNGVSLAPIYGSTINYIASGCGSVHAAAGCYLNGPTANGFGGMPVGPNGYVTAPTYWGYYPNIADREGLANIHIALPHPHDGGKDDIQLLYNTGQTFNVPNESMIGWSGALANVLDGTAALPDGSVVPNAGGTCPATTHAAAVIVAPVACAAPVLPTYIDQYYYTGPLGVPLTAANLGRIETSYFQGSGTNRPLGAPIPLSQADSETTGFGIAKIQYQHNFGTSAYARLYGYSNFSNRIDNGAVGVYQDLATGITNDYAVTSHTRGAGLVVADQLNAHHLLSFDAGYTYSNASRNWNLVPSFDAPSPIAYLVSSAHPTAGCYSGSGQPAACADAAQYGLPPLAVGSYPSPQTLVPTAGSPVLGTEHAISCGGAPCEYLAINNGANAELNIVSPAFTNASVSDLFKVTDRLTLNASLRFEDFTYNLAPTQTLGNELLVNDYNASHCVSGLSVTSRALGSACPAGSAPTALTASSPARLDYGHIFSPRLGATYQLGPNTVLRASYGRFTQPAQTSSVDATYIQSSAPDPNFYANFGFPSYARSVEPEISYNTDFSFEHAMPQAGLALKVSPFYRKTTDEFVSILIDPKTGFIGNVNGLNRTTKGVELAVTKGDFNRDGWAAQLAYTYTYATTKFKVFPNGGSFVAGANIAIAEFNGYTKFCAANPTSSLCGSTFSGAPAAPCYTTAGAAAPACGAGTVANPYWNAAPTALLDPNADYIPYNQNLGAGVNGIATSYVVPHVLALILNYKRGPLSITPSFQVEAGARYGSPLAAQGVAPDTCGAVLASPLAGDPRYAGGIPGPGSPYNASSCTAVIPIPNPQTGHFDAIGEYVQPTLLATNLSLSYAFTKRLSLNLIGANLFNRCFGGSKVPWGVGNLGCAYIQAGTYVANVYNPGDAIQPYAAQSYVPNLGGTLQGVPASSSLPFELFMDLRLRL